MKKLSLIEPQPLGARGVPCRTLANLGRPEPAVVQPLKGDIVTVAKRFDGGPLVGLKNRAPVQIEARVVVADIMDAARFDQVKIRLVNARCHFRDIRQRRLASVLR